MIRFLAALSGAAVICAATNANVVAGGGWNSTDAPLIVAIGALLTIGMAYASIVWRDGSRLGSAALILCLVSGETYWLGITAERELASRETAAAPHAAAARGRSEAQARVAAAEAALAALPDASPRLSAALAAKSAADAAVTAKASERGCAANCRALLQGQVDAAATEVAAARTAHDADRQKALRVASDARTALAALPAPVVHAGLASRIGVPQWAYDLVFAALRSLAIAGGSIAIALAIHSRNAARATPTTTAPPVAETVAEAVFESAVETPPPKSTMPIMIAPPIPPREHVSRFLAQTITPDPSGTASLKSLHRRYAQWCASTGTPMLATNLLGAELREIIGALGLEAERTDSDLIFKGARIEGKSS